MKTRESAGTAAWLGHLEEIVRLTAPPACVAEIGDQALAGMGTALGARSGVMLTWVERGDAPVTAAVFGAHPGDDLLKAGEAALRGRGVSGRQAGSAPRSRSPLVFPLDLAGADRGVLAFDGRVPWPPGAVRFGRTAAQVVSAALRAARAIEGGRAQGELLARRNIELEALREIAATLQAAVTEEEVLQGVIDLVLGKLGLQAGWIFWGEESRGCLELAASRGVTAEFERRSRESGIGTCLCLDVFNTGKLRVARNTTECPRLPDLVEGHKASAHACIPLKFDRGVLGVMNIANRAGEVFSYRELEFLETVGTQVCLAVDRLRTGRAESRRNAEARALASLAEAIGSSLDQDKVLAAIGDYFRQLLGFDRCAVFLGRTADRLLLAHLSGPPLEGVEVDRAVDLQVVGSRALPEALRERRTIVIDDAASDPRSNPELARRWGIGSAILVPLMTRERVSGVLHASREREGPFTPDEIALAGVLAGQAAVAIESARLYREVREALVGLQEAQHGMMRSERLAAIGTLAAGLAHEVRNPLNSISLTLVLLTRRLARLQAEDPGLATMVDSVRREIERLDQLVEEFLSLSTLDSIERQESDPAALAREVLALMSPLAESQGIEVREALSPSLPLLPLDRQKIKQVLINLARNAFEAMSGGGTLTLTARPWDDGVAIEVTDTGVGIEPGLDVFDFFTTTKRGGTGLGLPISRRIVEAHGGLLSYESVPGRGSTFRVALSPRPVSRVPDAEAP